MSLTHFLQAFRDVCTAMEHVTHAPVRRNGSCDTWYTARLGNFQLLFRLIKGIMANSITALCSHQLPTAYFNKLVTLEVRDCGKLRNLMSPSMARDVLSPQKLRIEKFQSMEEVIMEEEQQGEEIMTNKPLFSGVCQYTEFQKCEQCDELKVIYMLFNSKVSYPNLEVLSIWEAHNITALCSHQLPSAYFNKLETLEILEYQSMEEVIAEEEQEGEEMMTNEPFFSREVRIHNYPKMKTFVQQGSVSTPNLKSVNSGDEVKVDDQNKWVHESFNSKEQGTSNGYQSEATDGDEFEDTDGEKSEASDHYESDATNDDESKANVSKG
ncbi:hypothetical protein BC332_26236 [Capsicum chinense]|nr:hypothetical protein BC332_26236 [Capsicum chinense]